MHPYMCICPGLFWHVVELLSVFVVRFVVGFAIKIFHLLVTTVRPTYPPRAAFLLSLLHATKRMDGLRAAYNAYYDRHSGEVCVCAAWKRQATNVIASISFY